MKILVTGSREWADEKAIEREFRKLPQGTTIVHGACPTGADSIADKLAMKFGFQIRRYPADWDGEREATGSPKAAGPKRNSKMIREEHKSGDPIAFALAFTPDLSRSRGTKDCVERAKKAGIRVQIVEK